MKLAIVQKDIGNADLAGMLEKAKATNPDLICFGELAANGCVYETRKLPSLDTTLKQLAGFDGDVMAGVAIPSASRPTNSYVHICGEIRHIYHKVNLFEPFNEPNVFQAGQTSGIWETAFGRVGIAICYDLRFDDLFVKMREAEVDLIFVPAAWPRVRADVYLELLANRASETGAIVVGINAVGSDSQNEFGGSSSVIAPDGEILAQADETSEMILECEI